MSNAQCVLQTEGVRLLTEIVPGALWEMEAPVLMDYMSDVSQTI